MTAHTTTGLKRWSCLTGDVPAANEIKSIHIYDFDNTLFLSPLPNPKLWASHTIGHLQGLDVFENGGWWHDVRILAATGEGVEVEEPRKWAGWWNEQIVSLVELSMQQQDALTVLLTGRSERGFADLIKRMVESRSLKFDMICLKPEVGPNNQRIKSTILFKEALLDDVMHTYNDADEIRVYEDRKKHVDKFQLYFKAFNHSVKTSPFTPTRLPITAEVIHVVNPTRTLDPVTETTEIQRMLTAHNTLISTNPAPRRTTTGAQKIHRTILSTHHHIPPSSTSRLLSLLPPALTARHDPTVTLLATHIPITPHPAPASLLEKLGGLGKATRWRVTHLGSLEGRVWAASVRPIDSPDEGSSPPVVVLATKGRWTKPGVEQGIREWKAVGDERAVEFETRVANKEVLKIVPVVDGGARRESSGYKGKRKVEELEHKDGDSEGRRRWQGPDQNHAPGGLGYQQQGYQQQQQQQQQMNAFRGGGGGGGVGGGRAGYQNQSGGWTQNYAQQGYNNGYGGISQYAGGSRGGGGGGGGGGGRGNTGSRRGGGGRGRGDGRGRGRGGG